MLSSMFKKTYTLVNELKADSASGRLDIPEGLWRKCNHCGRAIYREDVQAGAYICPKCGGYFRMHAGRRIEMLADEGSFESWDETLVGGNPLEFKGYEEKLRAAEEKSGLKEAVVCGRMSIEGQAVAFAVMDSRFMMGSMGSAVGEKLCRLIERAQAKRLPLIIYTASGGARMQEGIVSLMQMAKTSAALRRFSDAGGLYISVLTHPTTGGVTASFAMLGDIILAEPGALIGFAGPRVIEQTIKEKLPEGFQTAEFLLEHGFVDALAPRTKQRQLLAQLLRLHEPRQDRVENRATEHLSGTQSHGGLSITESRPVQTVQGERSVQTVQTVQGERPVQTVQTVQGERPVQAQCGGTASSACSAWQRVQRSRASDRPFAQDYIAALTEDFVELHGDRLYGDDAAIIGGLGTVDGRPVTIVGVRKGRKLKESIACNFGMPNPEGYRKALRLMRQAEKFGRPVLLLVDTAGAYPGKEAEERGQGEAIARNLWELSGLRTPVLSIFIGEGGSGGALALGLADEVWMFENACYSILSPEGFASIIYKDAGKAALAAESMKLTAAELYALGIIERVLPEPEPLTLPQLTQRSAELRREVGAFFERCAGLDTEALLHRRYERFRKF